MDPLIEALQAITDRLDALQAGSSDLMRGGTQMMSVIDALITADRMRSADIAQIKADIALIKEALKSGSRH